MSDETVIEVSTTHTVKVVPVTRYEVRHSASMNGVRSFGLQSAQSYGLFEDRARAEKVAELLAKSLET